MQLLLEILCHWPTCRKGLRLRLYGRIPTSRKNHQWLVVPSPLPDSEHGRPIRFFLSLPYPHKITWRGLRGSHYYKEWCKVANNMRQNNRALAVDGLYPQADVMASYKNFGGLDSSMKIRETSFRKNLAISPPQDPWGSKTLLIITAATILL